ncbi:diaminohydroxyphosphoribosylaminopyrimidine deaminase [Stappia sp. ES.058]|nr:diaminohydroxyphosphoribosylaminopyrimidine deaminase [Stappia sp. ES.058]
MTTQIDTLMMKRALALGAAARGTTAPNPAIGCVIAKNDRILGEGATQPGGRPHAEAMALAAAGTKSRGATLYVTLEPCAHIGRSPPCADAIIAADIKRVVVALAFDPDPRVSGRGIEKLRTAGIEVETGLLCDHARDALAGFLSRITRNRALACLLFHDRDTAPRDEADDGLKALRANHDLVLAATPHREPDNARPPQFLLHSARGGKPLCLRSLHNSLGAQIPPTCAFSRLDDLLTHLGDAGHNDVLIEAERSIMADLAGETDCGSTEALRPGGPSDAPAPLSGALAGGRLPGVHHTPAMGTRS